MTTYWDIVEAIVSERGRRLRRYRYFEDLWAAIEEGFSLIFFQAPTGAGKTEAVSAPFFRDLIDYKRRWHSMLHVLPTRSLVFNMFNRICRSLHACRIRFGRPSRIVVNYDHGGFIPAKTFLEGDITTTTYDTLLYTFYGFRSYGHHLFLSIGKIAGSLIVLDEVHLLQDSSWYAPTLLPHHISNLIKYGGTTIIMTATLPQILLRETLSAAERIDANVKKEPVVMNSRIDKVERGKISVELLDDDLLEAAVDLVKEAEKPALLIFNTVERAVKAYELLKENQCGHIELLHSRIIAEVRRSREEVFEKKETKRDLVIVATQVAEVGIDYDFRTIITELSPIDSLIQRLGRCGRRKDGVAFISTRKESAMKVYPKIIVDKTAENLDEYLLSKSVMDVESSSELVNRVYTEKVVNSLRKAARGIEIILRNSHSFIKEFSRKLFIARNLFDNAATGLLRLGVELPCILLPDKLYQEVLELCRGGPSEVYWPISLEDLRQLMEKGSLSLSLQAKYKADVQIPGILHEIEGKRFYLQIHIASGKRDKETFGDLSPMILKRERINLSKMGKGFGLTNPFIINPEYYSLYEDGYHLGLVKPYGRGS